MKYQFIAISLFLAQLLQAFNRPNHSKIGEAAIDNYRILTGKKITAEEKEAFRKGCIYEDAEKKLISKYFNEHFYRSDMKLNKMRTFTKRLERLKKRLLKYKKKKKNLLFWETLGKMTHYYQDMACPPHVIPIYHLGSDRFDDVDIRVHDLVVSGFSVAEMLDLSKLGLTGLLDHYSGLTYLAVQQPLKINIDGIENIKNWGIFWTRERRFIRNKKFGTYGDAGNNFGLSDTCFKCRNIKTGIYILPPVTDTRFKCLNKDSRFIVKKLEYENFIPLRIKQAVQASMVMIYWGLNVEA